MSALRYALVIPAFRESGRVGDVVREVRRLSIQGKLPTLDVLVVDDGSPDGTALEAAAAGARVLRHPFNLGYGTALHTGYCTAFRAGYDRVLQMDADGQHDASMLRPLVEALDHGADIALGSRYLSGNAPRSSLPRRVGTRVFAWLASRLIGTHITDPTSGFQGLSRRALESVVNDGFPEDYPDADVLVLHHKRGLRVREVEVVMHERKGGMSMHRGARIAYYGYKMMLTLALMPIRRATPLRVADTVARPLAQRQPIAARGRGASKRSRADQTRVSG
ncbi:MAG: glycosyltransferase family 2 protein [Planctomycetota bacterium]